MADAHEICTFMEVFMNCCLFEIVDRVLSSCTICADVYKSCMYIYIHSTIFFILSFHSYFRLLAALVRSFFLSFFRWLSVVHENVFKAVFHQEAYVYVFVQRLFASKAKQIWIISVQYDRIISECQIICHSNKCVDLVADFSLCVLPHTLSKI